MSKLGIELQTQQNLQWNQSQLQAIHILQMNSAQLLEHLGQTALENPVLEQEENTALQKEFKALQSRISWLDSRSGGSFSDEDNPLESVAAAGDFTNDLAAHLKEQLHRLSLEKPLRALTAYLADLLDEDGYLPLEELDALRKAQVPEMLLNQAVSTLQELDPPGVGARNLEECLTLQLLQLPGDHTVALDMVESQLDALSRGSYGAIAKALNVSENAVKKAAQEIRSLDPKPGSSFGGAEPTAYIRPDLFVTVEKGKPTLILNEYYLPRIMVSPIYRQMAAETEDREVKKYLREKIHQVQDILSALERRNTTLRRCAQTILDIQADFFVRGSSDLSPLTLEMVAQRVELHPSTVSRAIRDKYLQCSRGTYPLRYFFDHSRGPKAALAKLIREENREKPLSDQKLTDLLNSQGYALARRTVAKYREALGFPAAGGRKR